MKKAARILCIEDEPLLLQDLVEELEDAGYEAIPAADGQAALDQLKQVTPDLILCDIMMPRMSGPELLAHVREKLPALSRVPFIFLTALATREDIIRGKKLGADDYLTKPLDFDMLLATVEARLKEVDRIDHAHKEQLLKIEKAIRHLSPHHKGPLRVAIVSAYPKITEPIRAALDELGCEITLVPEDTLARKKLAVEGHDIILLLYSKVVHYYLQYVTSTQIRPAHGKVVLLAPPNLTPDQRTGLLETGIDGYIDYPYRPVDVFKIVMDRLQAA